MAQQPHSVPRRPTAVVVIAILNLIFGGLGILFGLCGYVFLSGAGDSVIEMGRTQPGQVKGADWATIQENIGQRAPYYTEVVWGGVIGDAIASVLLIISGLGLLRMQRWARFLALTYGVLQLLHTIAYSTYTVAVVLPVMGRLWEAAMAETPLGFANSVTNFAFTSGYAGTIVGVAVAPIYPVVVLCFMFLPSVRRALQRPTPSSAA